MRTMEFTMSRPGLVEPGQEVEITEGKLPNSSSVRIIYSLICPHDFVF